jgi:hypothetical protein
MKPFLTACLLAAMPAAALTEKPAPRVAATLDIAPVWSAHPVGFALLTHAPWQFVAYYDDERRMTVAWRKLDQPEWRFHTLPITTGWDSHNYIALALDQGGHLHLSGDMHCTPLRYFRSVKPFDPSTFERLDHMTGDLENRTTYPRFIDGPDGELIFTYRDGGSGNGNQIFNRYDPSSRAWTRLINTPLTDGEGKRNAYFHGPVKGPDGWFHLAWVWRETPDASTNHDLSHARSRDLRHWETAAGKPLKLPIRLNDGAIIDPVPTGGGLINGNSAIGFDHLGRVAISYHKHDQRGHTQPWTARFTDGKWTFHQIADWPARWEFGGNGSIPFGIHIGALTAGNGSLTQAWSHFQFGRGIWTIDPDTLRATGSAKHRSISGIGRVEGSFPGLQVKSQSDSGQSGTPGLTYQLRWETLGANRDKPRTGELPPPSMLRLLTIRE